MKYLYFQVQRSSSDKFILYGSGLLRVLEMIRRLKPSSPAEIYSDGTETGIILSFLSGQQLDPYLTDLQTVVPELEAFKGNRSKLAAGLLLANKVRVMQSRKAYYFQTLAKNYGSLELIDAYEHYLNELKGSVGDKVTFRGTPTFEKLQETLKQPFFTFINCDNKVLKAPAVMAQMVEAAGETYAAVKHDPTRPGSFQAPTGIQAVYGKTIGSRTNPELFIVTNLTSAPTQIKRYTRDIGGIGVDLYNDQDITKFSKIDFVELSRDSALYYRDLWVHKLHSVSAERNFLMLIDGRAFTVFGLQFHQAITGTEHNDNYVHEIYGISCPSKRWQTLNRLYMDLLTSFQFRNWIVGVEPQLSLLGLKSVKTACISRMPEVRLNRGPIKITSRKQMPNGSWFLEYLTPFQNKAWRPIIIEWLDYEARLTKLREQRAKNGKQQQQSETD